MPKNMNYGPRYRTSGYGQVRLRGMKGRTGAPLKPWNELSDEGKRKRLLRQRQAVQDEMKELTVKKISLAHVRGLDDD